MKTVCCEHKDGKINPRNRTGAPDINPNDQLIFKKMAQNNLKEKKSIFQNMVLEQQVKHVDLNHYFTLHTKIYLRWATALKLKITTFLESKRKILKKHFTIEDTRIASRHVKEI